MFHVLTYKSAPQHEAREGLSRYVPPNSECAYQTVQTNMTCSSSLQESPATVNIRSHISKSSRMKTSDLLHVAGRGWRNTLPPRRLCRQVGTCRNGFLRWDYHRALRGESTLQKTLKLCLERPTGIYGKKSNTTRGVRFPKTLWVSVL